ncbi:hypothetical protein Goshw_020916, partial [Gossypium schwendimanii]|nr:hypothetical protein [Gossypium schwendimanii]
WTELLSNHSPLLYTLSLLSIVSTPHNHTLHPSLLPSPSPNTLSSVFHRIPILSKSPHSLFHGIKHSFSPSLSIPSYSFKSSISAKACAFRDPYEKFKKFGAEVVGISGDDPSSHKVIIILIVSNTPEYHRYGLQFTLLSDEGNKVRKACGVEEVKGQTP